MIGRNGGTGVVTFAEAPGCAASCSTACSKLEFAAGSRDVVVVQPIRAPHASASKRGSRQACLSRILDLAIVRASVCRTITRSAAARKRRPLQRAVIPLPGPTVARSLACSRRFPRADFRHPAPAACSVLGLSAGSVHGVIEKRVLENRLSDRPGQLRAGALEQLDRVLQLEGVPVEEEAAPTADAPVGIDHTTPETLPQSPSSSG